MLLRLLLAAAAAVAVVVVAVVVVAAAWDQIADLEHPRIRPRHYRLNHCRSAPDAVLTCLPSLMGVAAEAAAVAAEAAVVAAVTKRKAFHLAALFPIAQSAKIITKTVVRASW